MFVRFMEHRIENEEEKKRKIAFYGIATKLSICDDKKKNKIK